MLRIEAIGDRRILAVILATEWAHINFSQCNLGDNRRTKRLVRVASRIAENTSGAFPQQLIDWPELQAAYRLMSNPQVTFSGITRPHYEATKAQSSGRFLILSDTTELDFGKHRQITGLSRTGNGSGQGFLLHNSLMINAENARIVGLAAQTIHYRPRKPVSKSENATQRKKRSRESDVWRINVDSIGAPPPGCQFIHVFDRGGDDFENLCRIRSNSGDWVIRVKCLSRRVFLKNPDTGELSEKQPLKNILDQFEVLGGYDLEVRARNNQEARTASLEVRAGQIEIPVPHHKSPWLRDSGIKSITTTVVIAEEQNPPTGCKPLKWVIYTSLPVATFDDAWEVIEFYEHRWLIEEYHKCLKTGCRVTQRQLKTKSSLEAMTGLLSICAVRLLSLKTYAVDEPEVKAKTVVSDNLVDTICQIDKKLPSNGDISIRQFLRSVAKLGGFIGRKSDGEPGWITIWRGWEKLNLIMQAIPIARKINNCV